MAFLSKIFKSSKSFSDLKKLVNASSNEVFLDSDYFFKISKDQELTTGIELSTDNLIIDGNGHSVDGAEVSVPFVVNGNNIVFKNIIFKDCVSVFVVNENSSLKIINCEFNENINSSSSGVIINKGEVKISNSKFIENAGDVAGCIYNDGYMNISSSCFESNYSNNAGAIHNNTGAKLSIFDCKFISNSARRRYGADDNVGSGGAIGNFGFLEIKKSEFYNNRATTRDGGAIASLDGSLFIYDSFFKENSAMINGGAICSICEIEVYNSIFEGNSSSGVLNDSGDGGDCFYIRDCELICSDCKFIDSHYTAIVNWGSIQLKNSVFEDNHLKSIINYGKLKLYDAIFRKNEGILSNYNELEIYSSQLKNNHLSESNEFIYNKSLMKIQNSNFLNNNMGVDCIFNEGILEILESKFYENDSNTILYNSEKADLKVSHSRFGNNNLNLSSIYNSGEKALIMDTLFESNSSDRQYSDNIINITTLDLIKPSIIGFDYPNIMNNGYMVVKKSDESILKFISGDGQLELIKLNDDSDASSENMSLGFGELKQLIHESLDKIIVLESDFRLNKSELDFFEGGIELTEDNLHIDGMGHVIDGNNQSRIFYIMGKNIVLENIIFKNAYFSNGFQKHSNGGGALRILKDASVKLLKCKFINCCSDDDAGVILNKGHLTSENNLFENCNSELFAGAIYNKGSIVSKYDSFRKNNSKIAIVYNEGSLTFQSMNFENCLSSHISNDIFNIGDLYFEGSFMGKLLNYGNINVKKTNESISFAEFSELISDACDEISLNHDISYDFEKDKDLSNSILIDKDIVIEGNNHIIDGKNSSSFFKITGNVIFRNLTFKNGFSYYDNLIDILQKVTFKNCNFINNNFRTDIRLLNVNDSVSFINCNFINNSSRNMPLINNENHISIDNSNFISNHSENNSIVSNTVACHLTIKDSKVIDNSCASINHSILINSGTMDLLSSICSFNQTKGSGGVLYNHRPYNETEESMNSILNIDSCIFSNNSSKISAGVLINDGFAEAHIKNSKFIKNSALMHSGASVIENRNQGYLEVSDSLFIDNKDQNSSKSNDYGFLHYNGTIANSGIFNVDRCEFK